eukprot:jgi/Orpsp1_1/1191442/evm.model.d7180000085838.1
MCKFVLKLILLSILLLLASGQIQVSEDCKQLNTFLNTPINTQCCSEKNECDQDGFLTKLEICLTIIGRAFPVPPDNMFNEITKLKLKGFQIIRSDVSTLPNEISKLTKLKKLILNDNSISIIPSTIGELKELEELELGKNNLINFNVNLSKLTKLKKLNLSINDIDSIPSSIGDLENLEE